MMPNDMSIPPAHHDNAGIMFISPEKVLREIDVIVTMIVII